MLTNSCLISKPNERYWVFQGKGHVHYYCYCSCLTCNLVNVDIFAVDADIQMASLWICISTDIFSHSTFTTKRGRWRDGCEFREDDPMKMRICDSKPLHIEVTKGIGLINGRVLFTNAKVGGGEEMRPPLYTWEFCQFAMLSYRISPFSCRQTLLLIQRSVHLRFRPCRRQTTTIGQNWTWSQTLKSSNAVESKTHGVSWFLT